MRPDAIVQQVWQGIVPTDWKIMRGKRRSARSLGVSAAVWTALVIALLTILAVVVSVSQMGRPAPAFLNPFALSAATIAGYPALLVVAAAALALALLVGIITAITSARRHAGDPDPTLVLVPQGFVEYISRHKPLVSIPYAQVASVNLRVKTSRYSWRNQPASQAQANTRPIIWLDLLYDDGHTERWKPRADFGPPEYMYQTIIKAHALYDILYKSER